MSAIEIKPEAPWIRRSDEGVIFTDDVVGVDVELSESSSSSSSSQESEREEDEEEEYEGAEDDDVLNHSDQLGEEI